MSNAELEDKLYALYGVYFCLLERGKLAEAHAYEQEISELFEELKARLLS